MNGTACTLTVFPLWTNEPDSFAFLRDEPDIYPP